MYPLDSYPRHSLPADTARWSSSFEKPHVLFAQYIESIYTLLVKSPLNTIYNAPTLFRLSKQHKTSSKPSLVLAGGPSLTVFNDHDKNQSLASHYNIFACNYYPLYYPSGITPTHLVLSDPNTIKPASILRAEGTATNTIDLIEQKQNSLFESIRKIRPKIYVPFSFCKASLSRLKGHDIYFFNDYEARFFNSSVSPLYPRSYTSMTAYKSIAIALFLSDYPVYILGVDNTYPHDVLVDSENRVCRLERHANSNHFIMDHSPLFSSVSDALVEMSVCFKDLHKFPSSRIINLDPHSLVDAFPKIQANVYDFLL